MGTAAPRGRHPGQIHLNYFLVKNKLLVLTFLYKSGMSTFRDETQAPAAQHRSRWKAASPKQPRVLTQTVTITETAAKD